MASSVVVMVTRLLSPALLCTNSRFANNYASSNLSKLVSRAHATIAIKCTAIIKAIAITAVLLRIITTTSVRPGLETTMVTIHGRPRVEITMATSTLHFPEIMAGAMVPTAVKSNHPLPETTGVAVLITAKSSLRLLAVTGVEVQTVVRSNPHLRETGVALEMITGAIREATMETSLRHLATTGATVETTTPRSNLRHLETIGEVVETTTPRSSPHHPVTTGATQETTTEADLSLALG